jgi:hypothetical protein
MSFGPSRALFVLSIVSTLALACGGAVRSDPTPPEESHGQTNHTGGDSASADPPSDPPPSDDAGISTDSTPADAAPPPVDPPAPKEPPPFPKFKGTCPKLVSGATADTSVNDGFVSAGDKRSFRLLVPKTYDSTKKYPLVFAYHWLNASSGSFVRDGELETAIDQMDFIAVLPDDLKDSSGKKVYQLDWPFAEVWGKDKELQFFDDLLACVDGQFAIDHRHVHAVGVSAGGLWVTLLSTTARANWIASFESLSGGLGEEPLVFKMDFVPQPNKFPALVLWGGTSDWMILSFDDASKRYRDALLADGHFVETCTHDKGHAMPPIDPPPDGSTKFKMLWQFFLDHPYGLPPGTSPYTTSGLPASTPAWCKIASALGK